MKEEITMQMQTGINRIWLSREDNLDVITQGKIVVTDSTMFNEIIDDLKDISKYIFAISLREAGGTENFIKYTSNGAVKYIGGDDNIMYVKSLRVRAHDEYYYINPKAKLYQLLAGDRIPNCNLLDLFTTLESENSTGDRLKELKRAQEIIRQLENCSLPIEMVKKIIRQMWPNFGYYATDVLNCIDIEMEQEYDIKDLSTIVETSEKNGIKLSDDVRIILSKKELAQSNTKVLSLAKKANRLINPSK